MVGANFKDAGHRHYVLRSSRSRGSLFTLSRLRFLSRGRRRSVDSSPLASWRRSVSSTALVPVCSASHASAAALALCVLQCRRVCPDLPRRPGRQLGDDAGDGCAFSSRSALSARSARRGRSISRAAARAEARAFISASLRGAGRSKPRSRLPRSVRGAEAGAEARRRFRRRIPSP